MNKILLLAIFMLLSGCWSNNQIVFPETDLELSTNQDDVTNVSCSIKYKSAQYVAIKNWFSKNNDNWKKRPATYRPTKVLIGHKFKAVISGNLIILDDLMVHDIDQELEKLLTCR